MCSHPSLALPLSGTLLNDAIAIVQFPSPEAIDGDPKIVDRHLEAWASGKIGKTACDEQTLCALKRFCEKLKFYIEDYISKATSSFPARAYLDTPSPIPQTRKEHTIQMKDLLSSESERLMTAFIEYELLCKINCFSRSTPRFNFKHLERCGGRTVSPWRAETLQCVFEYIRSLYGALFARSSNAWLPTDCTQLVFPDNVLFGVQQYAEDMDLHPSVSPYMADTLAAFGFDLITSLLDECEGVSSEPRHGRGLFHGLARWLRWTRTCGLSPWLNPLSATPDLSWPDSPALCQRLLQLIPNTTDEEERLSMALVKGGGNRIDENLGTQLHRQMQIYRQRAWVFFDDARLFPESSRPMPCFPTAEEIISAEARAIRQYTGINGARVQHRSRFWHETKMPPYMDPVRTATADEDTWDDKGTPQ
ncbi:hypothetical protein B0T11DRAFT_297657 [Plectosphaerella cucumerina]|uniref:Uncharacterized protein n=1 Tax=Plectosphaerella cucumerina TaxID=40658 RepID=A0A8K0X2Z9_9PEZI|nr:hypothetical protein B0T11DRAFT_297657 [Plectosphaerella cucumerina]